jgi:hypothetical protein
VPARAILDRLIDEPMFNQREAAGVVGQKGTPPVATRRLAASRRREARRRRGLGLRQCGLRRRRSQVSRGV